jgi:hypothetical protein
LCDIQVHVVTNLGPFPGERGLTTVNAVPGRDVLLGMADASQ